MSTKETKESNKKPLKGKLIRILVPLALGVTILYFLYKGTNFSEMWHIIKDANYAILIFSLLFGLMGNVIRGLRWELLITPLGYHPKRLNLIYAILGNYAVNFLLPRAGEIWRCGIITKEEKVPFPKLFGTMVIDRLFDTIAVLCIVLIAFVFNVTFFRSYLSQNQSIFDSIISWFSSIWLYLGVILIITFIVFIFKVFRKSQIIISIKQFFVGIGRDMRSVWRMKQKKRFFVYTLGIWGSYFLYFYTTFFAFSFTAHLGITAGLIAFAISSVSMGVPTNGGIGAWHLAVIAALTIYGVQSADAVAFATAVFTIQSLWVILCGVFGIVALGAKK